MTGKIESDNDTSIELVYCVKHNFGSVTKDSLRQKEHITNSKGKCKFTKYNPKKHNPKYDKSKINNNLDDDEEFKNGATLVYEFAQSKIIKKVRSAGDHNRVFALVKINDHYKTIELGAWDSIQWITSTYQNETGDFFNKDIYKTALSIIISHAITDEIKIENIHSRIAFVNNEIFYDLCNNDYQLVKITKDGYSIIQIDGDTPLFRRKSSPLFQVKPKKSKLKNPIDELCNLLKIPQQNKILFKVHLIALFLESYPIPIMIFHGEQGSSKSTTTSTIKKIVDPSPENLASMPKKIDDLNIHLYNRYLSNFDNISYFDQEVSDNLCRAITGHTHIKRELYQDSKEIILSIQTRIILNGISPNIEFPDLMQRSIFYETKYIPKDQRLTEEEFNKKINSLIPYILNQIFNVLSNTLSIFDKIKKQITIKERMADFTVYGECISQSLGNDEFTFLEAYKNNLDSNSLSASESWEIIDIVLAILNNKKVPFEITLDELYNQSVNIADSKNIDRKTKYSKFPKSKSKLSGQLTRFNESFRNSGYEITIIRYDSRDGKFKRGQSIIKVGSSTPIQSKLIESSKVGVSPCHLVSDENQAQNDPKTDKDTKSGRRVTLSHDKSDKNDNSVIGKDTDKDNQTKSKVALSKNSDSRHKKGGRQGDKDDKDTLPTQRGKIKKKNLVTKKDTKSKIKSYSKKRESSKSFNCKTCEFNNFINLDTKSRVSDNTLYEIHIKSNPKHKLEYSDEVLS